jgi:hypothetical protein
MSTKMSDLTFWFDMLRPNIDLTSEMEMLGVC